MAKVPAFAKAFAGRWRLVEMDTWDNDFLDVRYGARDGAACAEFSWQGFDENDPACGRGWVTLGTAGRLVGHFFIHNGDDSRLRLRARMTS